MEHEISYRRIHIQSTGGVRSVVRSTVQGTYCTPYKTKQVMMALGAGAIQLGTLHPSIKQKLNFFILFFILLMDGGELQR